MAIKKIDTLHIEITSGDLSKVFEIDLMDISHHDIVDFEHAEELAALKTEKTGELHIATTNGRYLYVTRVPAIGDEVSYAFNGDAYPAGKVAKISKTLKVVTLDDGTKYYRHKQSGSWCRGCWNLIQGHHEERNPHI